MHLCEIAPELQLEILQFCPPRDLASLSTVHTSLRDVAEHALYSHIDFLIQPSDFIQDWHYNEGSLLHTLSTSARKSVMVKEVYIRFLGRDYWSQRASGGSNSEGWHPAVIMMYISDTLKKLPNLAELGIAYPWCGDPSGGQLSQVLRGGHFQLHMIWIDEAQDFRGIIANQPNLRFLGGFHNDQQLWGTIEGLAQNASCTMPTIVMLNFLYPRLDIYPSTHRPGQVRGECREIIRSLRKFTWDSLLGYHLTFNLWSIEEDIGLFNEVMKEIAICLKTCSHLIVECLEIQVHDLRTQSWNFPQFAKSLPLPLFETVKAVLFHFVGIEEDNWRLFIADAHLLVRELGKECPKVQRVTVINDRLSTSVPFDRKRNWGTSGPTSWSWYHRHSCTLGLE